MMNTLRCHFSAQRSKVVVAITILLAALLLAGCAVEKQELASTQAELTQVRDQLAAIQTEVNARQTEVAQLRQQIATAEAQTQVEQAEKLDLTQKLADAQAEVQAKETAVADAQKQLAATQAELDDVKFAAERLLVQAEAALEKGDLEEARRIADLMADKHSGTTEAARAAEIVTLIEKDIADRTAVEQARIAAATSKMKVEKDDIRSVTFYKDITTKDVSLAEQFYLYIGQKDQRPWLRLYIQYFGDDWLFVRKFMIKAGDEVFEIIPDYDEFERDNSGGSVWEWYDGTVTRKEVEMIKAVIAADKPVVRFSGETYFSDYEITAAEKTALQNVLDAFVALGGDLNNP